MKIDIKSLRNLDLKRTKRLFALEWRTALAFLLICEVVGALIAIPTKMLFDLGLSLSGYAYIGNHNVHALLLSPAMWVFALLAIVVHGLYQFFRNSALITLSYAAHTGHDIDLITLMRVAARQALRLVRTPKNLVLLPIALFLMPITNTTAMTGVVDGLNIPEFIGQDLIKIGGPAYAGYIAICVVGIVLGFLLSFTLHQYALDERDGISAAGHSVKLVLHNVWFAAVRIVIWVVGLALTFALLGWLSEPVTWVARPLLNANTTVAKAALIVGLAASVAFVWILCSLLVYLGACWMTQTYLGIHRRAGLGEPGCPALASAVLANRHGIPAKQRTAARVVVIILSLGLLGYSALWGAGTFLDTDDDEGASGPSVEVIAHRGGAAEAPENTIPAFERAIEEGADWVELDIRLTSDGVPVVCHDANTLRLTGEYHEVWNTTYAELLELDFGHSYTASDEYAGTKICTLDEVLEVCKDRVRMNIEIKADPRTPGIEEKIVDAINAHGMRDQVAIASIDYDNLVKVKQIDPDMRTIYDMVIAYGDISSIPDVDICSVDDFFITADLVENASKSGMPLYSWTEDRRGAMLQLDALGVDGLVTNYVVMARQVSDEPSLDRVLEELFK